MSKTRLLAAVVAVVMLVFCSCKEAFDISGLVSDENKNMNELITRTYSGEQLKEMIIFTSLEQLNAEYPIECLRMNDDGYQAVFKGEGIVMLVGFDTDGLRTETHSHPIIDNAEGFDGLAIGDSIRKVRELDPAGDYLFLYTGDSSLARESTHYLSSGYVYSITYDEGNNITSIDKKMI